MPGSPYLDQPPKGLWTWPRLLRVVGLPASAFLAACAYYGVRERWDITVTMLAVNWMLR